MPLRIDVLRYRGHAVTEPVSVLFDREGGTVGRSSDCNLVLADDCVSRKHARISFSGGRYHLTDESANGTLIANRDLLVHYDRVELEEGDILRIGDYDLEVNYVERESSTPPIRTEQPPRQADPAQYRMQNLADTPPARKTGPSLFVKELSIDDFFKDTEEEPPPPPKPTAGRKPPISYEEEKKKSEVQLDERKVDDFFKDIDDFFLESIEEDRKEKGGQISAEQPPVEPPQPVKPPLPVEPPPPPPRAEPPLPVEPPPRAKPPPVLEEAPPSKEDVAGMRTESLEIPSPPVQRPDLTDPLFSVPADRTDPIVPIIQGPGEQAAEERAPQRPVPVQAPPSVPPAAKEPPAPAPPIVTPAPAEPRMPTPPVPRAVPSMPAAAPAAPPAAGIQPAAPPADDLSASEVPAAVIVRRIQKELFNLFLKGARVEDDGFVKDEEIPAIMETIGAVFRELTTGLHTVLKGRTELKSEFRLAMTMVRPFCNNPLKLSPRIEDAMRRLLKRDHPSFLEPVEAVREGFEDLMNHQLAMNAGMRATLAQALDKFDPEVFAAKQKDSLFSAKAGKCWKDYSESYTNLREQVTEDIFGKAFVKAYEEQLEKLRSTKKK